MTLVYKETGFPVKPGDKVSGRRLEKFYAHIQVVHADSYPEFGGHTTWTCLESELVKQ